MIGFKHGQEAALNRIRIATESAAQAACLTYKGAPLDQGVTMIIADAVTAAFKEMLLQQYSDDDFENDIGLKT